MRDSEDEGEVTTFRNMDEFLRTRNIPESIITKFARENIDTVSILLMSDEELSKDIPKRGDRLSLMHFCKTFNGTKKKSLIEKLSASFLNRSNSNSTKINNKRKAPRAENPNRIVEIGWICFSKETSRLQQVRTKQGGGTRRVSIAKTSTCKAVLEKAIELFFPNGISPKGTKELFDFDLVDYKCHNFDQNITIHEMYVLTGMTTLRFYLSTNYKTILPHTATSASIDEVDLSTSTEMQRTQNYINDEDYLPSRRWQRHYGLLEAGDVDSTSVGQRLRRSERLNAGNYFSSFSVNKNDTADNPTDESQSVSDIIKEVINGLSNHNNLDVSEQGTEVVTLEVPFEASLETGIVSDIFENENSASNIQFPKSLLVLHRGHIFEELLDAVKTHKYNDFRQIQIEMILPNGTAEIASDTGGVLRDAIAEFWETFYAKCSTGTDLKIPYLRHDFQKEEWQTIGKILVGGLEALEYFPVKLAPVFMKQCFKKTVQDEEYIRDFLKYVCQSDALLLKTAIENFEEVDFGELLEFCSNYNAKWNPSKENIKTLIKQIAMEELLQKPAFVKQCFALECESICRTTDLDCIYKKLEPSDKNIIALFEMKEDDLSVDELQVYKHLKKFIKEEDQKVRCAFLRFCTGSDLPIQKIRLEFTDSVGFKRVPIAHTCSGLVQIPSSYENYVTFRCEWNNLLSSNIWVMDIV